MRKGKVFNVVASIILVAVFVSLMGVVGCAKTPEVTPAKPEVTPAKPEVTPAKPEVTPAKPMTLTLCHVMPKEAARGQMAEFFKQLVEEKTGGRVLIEIYPFGTLFKGLEEAPAMMEGKVDIVFTPQQGAGQVDLRFAMTMWPGVWSSVENIHRWQVDPEGMPLAVKEIEAAHKAKFIFPTEEVGETVFSSTEPVYKVTDFKGLKYANPGGLLGSTLELLGCAGPVIPIGEMYTALQTGLVQGRFTGYTGILSRKWYEVAPYMIDPGFMSGGPSGACFMNWETWSKLPADIQKILEKEVFPEMDKWGKTEGPRIYYHEAIVKLKDLGAIICQLDKEQQAEFLKVLEPLRDGYIEKGGRCVERAYELRD